MHIIDTNISEKILPRFDTLKIPVWSNIVQIIFRVIIFQRSNSILIGSDQEYSLIVNVCLHNSYINIILNRNYYNNKINWKSIIGSEL